MHRKRVTCELQDSYFPLDDNQTCHSRYIEWAIELLYNSVMTGSQSVWRPDQLVRRCWNENMSQRGWAPRPPVEQPRRTRTTHGDVRRGWGGQYVAVFVQSPTPSHTRPFQIKWEEYFSKRLCRRYYCVVMILHASTYEYTTPGSPK